MSGLFKKPVFALGVRNPVGGGGKSVQEFNQREVSSAEMDSKQDPQKGKRGSDCSPRKRSFKEHFFFGAEKPGRERRKHAV